MLTQKKKQLLDAEEEEEQRQNRLRELQDERDSLRLARDILQQQRERAAVTNSSRNTADEWVIIPRQDDS